MSAETNQAAVNNPASPDASANGDKGKTRRGDTAIDAQDTPFAVTGFDQLTQASRCDPRQRLEIGPLILKWLQLLVNEHSVGRGKPGSIRQH